MSTSAPLISREKWYKKIGYAPRNGQRAMDAAADAGYRFLSLFAFPQAGKSFGAAKHVEVDLLRPDCHGWLVAPTYTLGQKEFGYILTDFANVGMLSRSIGTRYSSDMRGGNMFIEFPWGSWVKVVSADNPSSLRMEQLDWIILCEASALPSNVYERFLYARIELRHGKVLVPTTPAGYNWVYDAFRVPSLTHTEFTYEDWKDCTRARVGGTANPRHDPAYWSAVVSATREYGDIYEPGVHSEEAVERARRLLPHPAFVEQFGGDFASYAGLIYKFNPDEHEVPSNFRIPDEWTHVVGWDHGADNPTAILFGSYSPDGIIYWWDEVYVAGLAAVEYARLVRSKLGMKAPSAIVIDPSAKQMRIELIRHGMPTTTPHDKQVEARITKVTALMRGGKWKVLRGRCPNLVSEMQSWEWDETPKAEGGGKPRPRQRCHALDAMGYAVLVPVPLPRLHVQADEDTVPGESPLQEWVWKGWRRHCRTVEEEKAGAEADSLFTHDPFDETAEDVGEYVYDVR